MPATSRRQMCLRRRSASVSVGGPSKSMMHEVLAGVQHLLQVVVAVGAHAQAGEPLVEQRLEHLQHLLLPVDQPARRVGAPCGGQPGRGSRAAGAASCRPGCASTGTSSADRARCTARARSSARRRRRQREVHLGGALAEQRRQIQVRADHARARRRAARRAPARAARAAPCGRRVLAVAGQHALEEAAQLLARVRPGRPLVGDVRLQHRQRARLAAARAGIRSRPRSCGARPGARAFRKRPISSSGLDALLQAAEHLQQVACRRSGSRPRRAAALMLRGSPSGGSQLDERRRPRRCRRAARRGTRGGSRPASRAPTRSSSSGVDQRARRRPASAQQRRDSACGAHRRAVGHDGQRQHVALRLALRRTRRARSARDTLAQRHRFFDARAA